MVWNVLAHPEFEKWLFALEPQTRSELLSHFLLVETLGPALGRPRVDTVKGSKHGNMKELRIQLKGDPWRVLFAFDPRRSAILLVGGNKRGDSRWYRTHVPIADERYEEHLKQLEKS